MKILMLLSATPHSSLSHRGLNFAIQLQRQGHHVTILAPSHDKYSHFNADDTATIEGVSLRYPRMFLPKSRFVGLASYTLSALLITLTFKSDVVVITKPTPLTVIGLVGRWRKGVRIVVDLDDLGSEVMAKESQSALLVRMVAACERLATRQADGVIVASRLLAAETKLHYPSKALILLSNGVDPDEFKPVIGTRPQHLIFFGGLNRSALLEPVLRALPSVVANHPTIKIDILGGGSALADLQSEAVRLGLMSNISFHGWIKLESFRNYTQSGDIGICIMPNERTTAACSNQKVFQYMALGLCTVVSDVGDLPTYVQHGKAGRVVAAQDIAQLSATLNELLSDEQSAKLLAQKGRTLTSTTYSWQHLSSRLAVFLSTLQAGEATYV